MPLPKRPLTLTEASSELGRDIKDLIFWAISGHMRIGVLADEWFIETGYFSAGPVCGITRHPDDRRSGHIDQGSIWAIPEKVDIVSGFIEIDPSDLIEIEKSGNTTLSRAAALDGKYRAIRTAPWGNNAPEISIDHLRVRPEEMDRVRALVGGEKPLAVVSKTNVEQECVAWIVARFHCDGAKPLRADLAREALQKWKGKLTGKGFQRAWAKAAEQEPGLSKTGPISKKSIRPPGSNRQ